MSEQINLNTNNLYITEEAFENFQANSIYEESEYITLSDIVPPQPASSDLICTIDDVPSESEIVSSSVLDYTTQDVNNAPHSSTDGDIVPKIVSETVEYLEYDTSAPIDYENSDNLIIEEPENTSISGSQQIVNIQTTKPAKRSRKKRTLNLQSRNITNSVDSNENSNANKSTINNESLGNVTFDMCDQSVNSVTKTTPKRRGRKSKNIQNEVDIISVENTTSENDNNIKYAQKKRGRKSKKIHNETNKLLGAQAIIESNALSKDNAINDISQDNSTSEEYNQGKKCVTVTTRKKRGRSRKIEDQTDKDLQLKSTNVNLPLSQNNTINDISLDNIVSEAHTSEDMNSIIENAPKRRGRKKKVQTETVKVLQSPINNTATSTEKLLKTSNTLKNEINTLTPLNSSTTELQNSQVSSNETRSISRKDRNHKNISISEQETVADDNIEQHNNNYENQKGNQSDSSDEDDDISLNKLKQTLDVKGDEENDNTEIVDMEIEIDNIVNVTVVDNNIVMPSVSLDQDIALEHNKEDLEKDQLALATETPSKRSSKMSLMSDFEYNIDKVVKDSLDMDDLQPEKNENDGLDNSLLTEDLSKRPSRRNTKKALHYEEDSDEDPFANVELSDEEPRRNRKKGYRYDSDDEYVPGNKLGKTDHISDSSDSTLNETLGEIKKQARKRTRKRLDTSSQSKSPRKRSKKYDTESSVSSIGHTLDVTTIPPDSSCEIGDNNDIEMSLKSSVIKINEDGSQKSSAKTWGAINEFENFIAKKIQGTDLKIKKVSSTGPSDSVITPLEIPVINPETKKSVEMCTQTLIQTTSCSVQTTTPYSVPMKTNVELTKEQAEKACEFLKSVVKTTAELGQLMTQKSEDFITKKINTAHVTDTFKMDYCVQKSFLLFKLAKHNLVQMEEDLAKQYEEFLEENDLSACREKQKDIEPRNKKVENSDSDCEIVEVSAQSAKEKPKFNPKTVFLNKELSIKIAKKSAEGGKQKDANKLNIKGRRTVWINDAVMVKKVKSNQSFLAQDSRNKKPPDNIITEKMVSDFFKEYYWTKVLSTCASFTSKEWLHIKHNYICNYFFVKPTTSISAGEQLITNNTENRDNTRDIKPTVIQKDEIVHPKTLFSLCTMVLQQKGYILNHDSKKTFIDNKQLSDLSNHNPKTLFQLCLNIAMTKIRQSSTNHSKDISEGMILKPLTLKTLSYQKVVKLISKDGVCKGNTESSSMIKNVEKHNFTSSNNNTYKGVSNVSTTVVKSDGMKSLFSLCFELIANEQNMCIVKDYNENRYHVPFPSYLHSSCMENSNQIQHININKSSNTYNANSLKHIAFYNVKEMMYKRIYYDSNHDSESQRSAVSNNAVGYKVKKLAIICFDIISTHFNDDDMCHDVDPTTSLTIDKVNTVSEEVFHNMDETSLDYQEHCPYPEDEQNIYYDEDEFEPSFENEEQTEDSNWVSQVQMKELRSCVSPSVPTDSEQQCVDEGRAVSNIVSFTPQIKIEPEEALESVIDPIIIKSEPMHNLDEMTVIPENVITKIENTELPTRDPIQRQNSSSYDEEAFEAFVRSNKMLNTLDETTDQYDKTIFSQSALRVRRQHEPDSDNENDSSMSLLIPQTYEPLHIDTAKGSLMQSSDEDDGNKNKKNIEKKTKRKARPKKSDVKCNNKDISATSKEKSQSNNELAILTRKMKEKIRQEERKNDSSDSETEKLALKLMKDNNEKKRSLRSNKIDDEIQCNNVDSTQQVSENITNKSKTIRDTENFTGFSAVDQNEISNYEKYVKFVYNKIIPDGDPKNSKEEQNVSQNNLPSKENGSENINTGHDCPQSPLIHPEEPVELLECEPSMPIFDDIIKPKSSKKKSLVSQAKMDKNDTKESGLKQLETDTPIYIERHGWKCYPIDGNDPKLYQLVRVVVEKLPESFIETYFKYQNVTDKTKDDAEIERLTNLQSLNKLSNTKEPKNKLKNKATIEQIKSGQASSTNSRAASPANNEHYNELSPSEDEGANVEDELPPPTTRPATENSLAKNSLMKDNDSDVDADITVKQEPQDDNPPKRKLRAGPKSKTKADVKIEPTDSLMLTADKMMNKELTLLHAPIVLDEKVPDAPVKGQNSKNKHKSHSRSYTNRDRQKSDDSSSEEEKQWVNTKEKLLKRMVKRQESTSMDDAKHAKLVSEFIERRGEVTRKKKIGRKRRSRKHLLEHEKQMRVLSNELYGEGSTHTGKKCSQAYFKGRRNIRKVLDKKSLTRSTVVANMEEFERKRRLITRQNKLRELLGYEEGVNVLVINDEVCLEYDFKENRPVVTVHPFFTRVMKAHQYEGVKFMWDACFESLEYVEAGHPGSGCILAHCMGLGKTLQVLALLHTVLTHPRVGMQRVLVCCPLSTVLNWVDEIHKWIGPVTTQIKVFELSKLKKTYERAYQLEDWYNGGGIFIIGYELFRSLTTLDPELDDVRPTIINKIRTALLDPGPDIIVCDEGHLLKNDCSVLAVAMSRVATKRRIVLTGTPMQNNLREYYCMVNFIKPNLLGTYSEYSNRFENPIMNGQHRDSREEDIRLMKARTHILHKVLEGCLQRQEASVLYPYLPKKYEYTVFITPTNCQSDLYKHYMQHYAKKNKQSLLKDFHVLQKIWTHPQVLHNFQMRREESVNKVKAEKLEDDLANEELSAIEMKPSDTEIWWLQYLQGGGMLDSLDSSNKFVAVFQILDECVELGDKVLIFSTSLFTMDALEYFLRTRNKWRLGHEYYRLDGSVPAEVRQKWCREFNAEHNLKTKLFLISTRAGSLGLNMTAANRVIILDTSWNPAHDIQSIFRVYRFGQKKDCYIYRLVAMGTMEQKIYERSVTKQAVACRVVDEQQIDRHYNSAELTELYSFDESGCGVAAGVAAGVTDVVLLRVARDSALHAVHEHDSLLRGSAEQGLPEHERAAAWMQFQQEHSNNQNELLPNLPKKSSKKSSGQDDAKPSTSKQTPEIKIENENQDTEPYEPKAKKGKKVEVIHHDIPIQTLGNVPTEEHIQDHSMDLDHKKEYNIVKKITDILIKHNFQNRNGHKQISDLVQRVREIVTAKKISNLPITDGLAENIAMVFLQKEKKSYADISSSIDVSLLSNEVHLESTRKRGRPTKRKKTIAHDEYIPPVPLNVTPESGEDSERRVRRKAALAAKLHLDTIAFDSVEEIDGDEWQKTNSDTDSVPETDIISYEKTSPLRLEDIKTEVGPGNDNKKEQTPKTVGRSRKIVVSRVMKKSEKNKKSDTDVVPSTEIRDSFKKNKELITNEMESILLSDDDEHVKKPNPPKKKSTKPGPKSASIEKPNSSKHVEVIESEDNEVVPLDPYILTNENFVKVVAHTYLTGNPMLDEDAALLAAQYSTQKAIKEMEKAGKNEITSGPIYDIAVKVLGKDVLRNFQKTYSQSKAAQGSMSAQQVAQKQNAAIMESNSLLDEMQETKPKVTPSPPPEVVVSDDPTSHATDARRDTRLAPASQPLRMPATPTATPMPRFKIVVPHRPAAPTKQPPVAVPLSALVPGPRPRLVQATGTQPPVVPVGFFKRSEDLPTNQSFVQSVDEECILPDDDDDVRIISDALPRLPGLGVAAPPVFTALPSAPITSSSVTPSPSPALVHTSSSQLTSLPSANPTFVRRNSRPLILTNVTATATSSKNKSENITPRYVPVATHQLQTKGVPILATQSQKMPVLKVDSGKVIVSSNDSTVVLAMDGGAENVRQRTKVPAIASESNETMCLNNEPLLPPNESTTVLAINVDPNNVQQRSSVSMTTPESTDTICLDSDEEPESSVPRASFTSAVAPTAKTAVPVMLTSNIANSQAVPVSLVVNPLGLAGNSTMAGDEFILSQSMPIPQINVPIDPNVNSTNVSNSTPVLSDTKIKTSKPSKQTEAVPVNSGETPMPNSDRQPRVMKRLSRVERPAASPIVTGTAKKMETKQLEQTKSATKTFCKPGDIIRITKTGVEILNRSTHNDDVSNVKGPSAATSVESSAVNQTSGEKAPTPEQATPPGTRAHSLSVSSSESSDNSRAPSPDTSDDPLSIFKNVVHIQADIYENSTSKKRMHTGSADKLKSNKLGDSKDGRDRLKVRKPDSTTIKVSERRPQSATTSSVAAKNSSKNSTNNRHVDLTGPTIVINDDLPSIPAKNTPSTSRNTPSTSKNIPSTSKNTPSTSKNTPSTSKNTFSSTSSLISTNKSQKSQSSVLSMRHTTKPSNTTVIGTSKNIVISNVSKPTLTKTPTTAAPTVNKAPSRIVRVTNVTTITPNKTTQKRPSEQTVTNTIKKKRTAEPMSLKDFDIDDIDDIIELE